MAVQLAEMEKFSSKIDKIVLLAGLFCHDVGKMLAYEGSNGKYRLTHDGQHIGHVVLGYKFVDNAMRTISIFMGEKYNKIVNMILSHHGAVPAACAEAKLLKKIDETCSMGE
jgi:23S rRNA maturation-related 3'-5' exoribonuclease YhaM